MSTVGSEALPSTILIRNKDTLYKSRMLERKTAVMVVYNWHRKMR